jgi:hypothetical protein
MFSIMLDSTRLFLFLTAAVLLAVVPGPGMLYVLARSLAGGKREGVLSALGTFLGGMVHAFAAALGVSVILARSMVAFSTVKYAGAAYLCFLGVRMILDALKADTTSSDDFEAITHSATRNPLWQRYSDGSAQSEDGAVFSFFHPAVYKSRGGAGVLAIRGAGNCLGGSEYLRRLAHHPARGATGKKDSLVNDVPAPAAHGHGRNHGRARDVFGHERKPSGGLISIPYNSRI